MPAETDLSGTFEVWRRIENTALPHKHVILLGVPVRHSIPARLAHRLTCGGVPVCHTRKGGTRRATRLKWKEPMNRANGLRGASGSPRKTGTRP
jgi:hypothetical protein